MLSASTIVFVPLGKQNFPWVFFLVLSSHFPSKPIWGASRTISEDSWGAIGERVRRGNHSDSLCSVTKTVFTLGNSAFLSFLV